MPIYEYICDDCKEPFERLVMKSTEKIACPQCGSRHHTLQFSIVASPAKSGTMSDGSASSGSAGGGCCTPSGCGCR